MINILEFKEVSSLSRINLMKSFIRGYDHSTLITTDRCLKIISLLTEEELSCIFIDGFNDIFGFLIAILYEPTQRLLSYIQLRVSNEYPFVNSMTFSLLRGIIVKKSISCSAAVPLFECIKEANTYILPTLLAPILPLFHLMLEDHCIVAALFPSISTILASLEGLCSAEHLTKYARKHFALRAASKSIEETIIEESPHPYDNNMNYIKTYDFPGAVRISITFDKLTETEPGCDFLQIFSDKECNEPISRELSGTFDKWDSPIIVNNQSITFKFKSDASVQTYGYKAYINVKRLGTSLSYKSPQIFYDLSRTIFLSLLNVSKRYNSPLDGYEPFLFSFPNDIEPICFTKEDSKLILIKIFEKFELDDYSQYYLSLFDPSSSFPPSYSYLNYIYEKIEKNDSIDVERLINLASMHPIIAQSPFPDQNSLFSKIGALLMQNTLGLPDDLYNFLFSALKESTAGRSFALLSYKAAGDICLTNNPTFEIVLQAATKIQIGLSIVGPNIINEVQGVVQSFLKAFSSIIIPVSAPSILRLSEKINSIFKEIAAGIDGNSPFFEYLVNNLLNIVPTTPDNTNPFVLFSLSIADSLDVSKANKPFILNVLLRSLIFCIPQSIPILQSILIKFKFLTSIEEKPEIISILESIGKYFSFNISISSQHELFDIGPSYSMARAKIIRAILDENKIDQLCSIISRHDDASLGALLVLSARTFPPHSQMTVRLKSDGSIVNILSMDYVEYRFQKNDGQSFSLPAFDVSSYAYTDLPFDPILPPSFTVISEKLVSVLFNSINSPFSRNAIAALAEITCITPLPFELSSKISYTNNVSNLSKQISLYKFHEGNAYIYPNSLSSFSIPVLPGIIFGYISSSKESLFHSFKISINNEKMIIFPSSLNFPVIRLESDNVTIGFFGHHKQLFVKNGKTFLLPPVFLSIFEDPCPFFIYKEIPSNFNIYPDSPLFLMNPPLPLSSFFTHAVANNTLISLFSEKMTFNGVSPNLLHLLPPLSPKTDFIYFEFNCQAESVNISIHPETIRSVQLYNNIINIISFSTTYGLYINCKDQIVFITINGEIDYNSLLSISLYSNFTITFELNSAEEVRINSGFTPFIFDLNNNNLNKNLNLLFSNPKLNSNVLPFSFDHVYKGSYPFDLSTVSAESQRISPAQLERPCILTSPDLDPKLYQRTGVFTPLIESDKILVKLFNAKNQTWMSIELPRSSAYSISDANAPDNIFAAHSRLQRSLKPFLSPSLYFPLSESAQKNQTLLTPQKQLSFFDERKKRFVSIIHSNSLIKSINIFNDIDELFNKVIELSTLIGENDFSGNCNQFLSNLYLTIFQNKLNLFYKLLNYSINFLNICNFESLLISNLNDATFVEIERSQADAIFIVLLNSSFSLPLSINSISLNSIVKIEKETDLTYCTMPGDMVTVSGIEKHQLAFFEIFPIYLNKIENGFRFSIHFISFLITSCNKFNLFDILHDNIFLPIFKHIMKRKIILFGFLISEWFLRLINENLIRDQDRLKYQNFISLDVLRDIKDSQLCISLTIFSLFIFSNDINENIIRERIISMSEPFFLTNNFKSSIASYIFNKVVFDSLSPLKTSLNFFSFLNKINHPLISTFAYNSYINSLKSTNILLIKPITDFHTIQTIEINTLNEEIIYFEFNSNINILLNGEKIYNNSIKKINNINEILIERNEETNNSEVKIIRPNKPISPTINDFILILEIYNEIKEKWTIRDESIATAMAYCCVEYKSLFSFSDDIFIKTFPNISISSSRFRVSCILLYILSSNDNYIKPTYNSKPFINYFSSNLVIYNNKIIKQMVRGYAPISTLSLSFFYSTTINHFSSLGCFPGSPLIHYVDLLNIKDPTTMLRVVRNAKNDLFEAPVFIENGAFLPKSSASSIEELNSFQGFGYHMAMNIIYGRSLPIPISRCVIRYSFGGDLIPDDFLDIDPDFINQLSSKELLYEKISPFIKQLNAIKNGVFLAIESKTIFDANNPVFPRILQLIPLTLPKYIKNDNLLILKIPLIREKMFENKISLIKKEDKIELVQELINNLND